MGCVSKSVKNRRPVRARIGGLLFVLPSIITVVIFVYGLIAWSVNVSLTNQNSGSKKDIKYVGLKNYTDLISDERFTHSLLNLFKFTVVFILGALITGFIMALLLEKGIKGEGFFRSFYLYPMAISFIAMGTVFNWILNSARDQEAGGLNLALQKIGLGFLQNDWYVSEKGAMYAMALPAIWQMSGYVLALFLAGFRGIPDDMREAARVDGASESQISMKAFDLIIGINGKSYVTQVVAVYMWESTFDSRDYAKGTAIAIVLLIMIAIVVVPYLRYNSKQQAYR